MRCTRLTTSASIVALAVTMVAVGSTALPASAVVSANANPGQQGDGPVSPLPQLRQHAASDFAEEAAALPTALTAAVRRDLGKSAEQYLADAETAKDASDIQTELARRGVNITHAELVRGTLRLRVSTEAQAKIARSSGAEVSVGPADRADAPIRAAALASNNGTGWAHFPTGGGDGVACSIGFHGYDKSDGQQQFLTAGHCDPGGNEIARYDMPRAGDFANATIVDSASTAVAGSFQFGSGRDAGLVKPDTAVFALTDAVDMWEGSTSGRPLVTSLRLRGVITATVGATLCKSGVTTGWTCGVVQAVNESVSVDGKNVNSIVSSACGNEGDSGGSNVIGQYAVGVTSGGGPPCGQSNPFITSYPLRSTDGTKSSAMANYDWEPQVQMNPPAVSWGSGSVMPSANLTGSVAGGDANYKVQVYWDGAGSPSQTVAVAANGSFSAKAPTTVGTHSFKLIAVWGSRNKSQPKTGTLSVAATVVNVNRLAGADRFATAVAMSKASFPSGNVPVVFIASGFGFADALSAGPAAAKLGGPVLLVPPDFVPASVTTELKRLSPAKVVVVGGEAAVRQTVVTALKSIVPNTVRLAGVDRFAASRAVARASFPAGATTVAYIANGLNFPDALSAGAAAGAVGGPVILVNGTLGAIDADTKKLLADLGVTKVKICGGTATVSAGIEVSLKSIPGMTVLRLAGADRFATSLAISKDAFPRPSKVMIASALTFPDGVAGSAAAAKAGSPLLVTRSSCVTGPVRSYLTQLPSISITLLGGTAVLSNSIGNLPVC